MNRAARTIAILLLYVTAVVGQEVAPPIPLRADTDKPKDHRQQFLLDIRIVEGKQLLDDDFPRGSVIAGFTIPVFDRASGAKPPVRAKPPEELSATLATPLAESELWHINERTPDARTLAEPRLITVENRPASFAINNKRSFDYLVSEGEGRFRAEKTPPHDLGLSVELTVRTLAGEPDAIELAPLKISQATLDGREPIDGLDLDAGKPIISKRSVETNARCTLGQARCVPIATTPGRQALMLLRVTRAVE